MLDETDFGDFNFNASTSELSKGTKSVHLNFKEAEILKILIANPDIIISKEDLITKVWGYDSDAGSNNVEAYISFLRRKFNFINSSTEIKSIKKMGYRLEKKND
jgi:DNA-binding response OmpR family regulator